MYPAASVKYIRSVGNVHHFIESWESSETGRTTLGLNWNRSSNDGKGQSSFKVHCCKFPLTSSIVLINPFKYNNYQSIYVQVAAASQKPPQPFEVPLQLFFLEVRCQLCVEYATMAVLMSPSSNCVPLTVLQCCE